MAGDVLESRGGCGGGRRLGRRCGRVRPEILSGMVLPLNFAGVDPGRVRVHSYWLGVECPFPWGPPDVFYSVPPLPGPGGGVHRLVPPTHSHCSPSWLSLSLLQTHKNVFLSRVARVHLFIFHL